MNKHCVHGNYRDMCDICKPAPEPVTPRMQDAEHFWGIFEACAHDCGAELPVAWSDLPDASKRAVAETISAWAEFIEIRAAL